MSDLTFDFIFGIASLVLIIVFVFATHLITCVLIIMCYTIDKELAIALNSNVRDKKGF